MKLSILIVNYNGKHYFKECLASIKAHVPPDHEVIVVDNASIDGSAAYIRDNYPDVRLIVSDTNLGFAGGNNLGARSAKGEFLLLLNNDTLLMDNLTHVLDLMQADATIGALGARMVGRDGEYRYSTGHFPSPWRLIKFSLLFLKRDGFRLGVFPDGVSFYIVDWVEGSFLLTPLEVWRRLGGLDESYFMYGEDIDYARRVADTGKRVVYCPGLTYVHFGGSGHNRVGMVAAGFRRYHKNHSRWTKKLLANFILDAGLLGRAVLYFAYSIVKRSQGKRALLYFNALRRKC